MEKELDFTPIKSFQQQKREKLERNRICYKAEQRRHKRRPDICARHLDTDDGLRVLRTEILWGGVNDTGINRR